MPIANPDWNALELRDSNPNPLVANSGHNGRTGSSEHGFGRSKAQKPYPSHWRCCTSLLYFSAVQTEHPELPSSRDRAGHRGLSLAHGRTVHPCNRRFRRARAHLLSLRCEDHVSDQASRPLRSNCAVENAAITFVLA
jgi:hypothetical protein